MAIEFSCSSCQKSYRVKDELAGKTAKCSSCGMKMSIPVLVPAASESDLDLKDLIEDVLPTKESATLTPAVTQKCPECGGPLTLDAVLCVACGYDKRSGDVLETESEKQIEEGEKRTTTDFLKRGGAISFLGAMLGAGVWFGLATVAQVGVEVGYPALLVGILAGLGMSRGYGKEEIPGGVAWLIASIMALAGIFAGKFLIFDQLKRNFQAAGKLGSSAEEVLGDSILPDEAMTMFNIFDIFFVLAAMAAAYALARGDHALKTSEEE